MESRRLPQAAVMMTAVAILADLLRNVILFAPLGATLAWSGLRGFRALVVGAVLSPRPSSWLNISFRDASPARSTGLQHKSEAVFAASCVRTSDSAHEP